MIFLVLNFYSKKRQFNAIELSSLIGINIPLSLIESFTWLNMAF